MISFLALIAAVAVASMALDSSAAIAEGEESSAFVVQQVDAGGDFTCMLTAEQTLVCAGRNTTGQTNAPPGR